MSTSPLRFLPGILLCLVVRAAPATDKGHELARLERSFWVHASLAAKAQKGYWGPSFSAPPAPSEADIRRAARLLTDTYAATRLYLVYHHEISLEDAQGVFQRWRQHCPAHVRLVPTLVLRMYDREQTFVFAQEELRDLVRWFQESFRAEELGVFDVHPRREYGQRLQILSERYRQGLVRVGIQPDEPIGPPFVRAVQDTWSGFCHGKTHDDWLDRGFGAETLRKWIDARNQQGTPVVWNLIVVAWDYSATDRGGYPGYDDAAKNMPLPAGRNRLGSRLILERSKTRALGGFSSDLLILQTNSEHPAHDGPKASFYETLKRGEPYTGYYSAPFQEIVAIFRRLRDGLAP